MDLSLLPITLQRTVPAEYLDENGHMNVRYYAHMFDDATYAFFDLLGFGLDYHERSGNGSFAVESHIRYHAEVREGQSVSIHSRAFARGEKNYHFMHFMQRDEDGALAATIEIVGVHINLRQRRSAPLPEEIMRSFDAMLAEHNQLDWAAPVCGAMGIRKK